MNNYWTTNYRAGQGGDFTFRYAVTSARKLDGGALTHLAMDEMRPAEVDYVVSQDKPGDPPRPLPATGAEFLETTGNGVSLITWAKDSNGSILRLAETTGKPVKASIGLLHSTLRSAALWSSVEVQTATLPVDANIVRVTLQPFQVVTVCLIATN